MVFLNKKLYSIIIIFLFKIIPATTLQCCLEGIEEAEILPVASCYETIPGYVGLVGSWVT